MARKKKSTSQDDPADAEISVNSEEVESDAQSVGAQGRCEQCNFGCVLWMLIRLRLHHGISVRATTSDTVCIVFVLFRKTHGWFSHSAAIALLNGLTCRRA
jgi:hypothetical protein